MAAGPLVGPRYSILHQCVLLTIYSFIKLFITCKSPLYVVFLCSLELYCLFTICSPYVDHGIYMPVVVLMMKWIASHK